MKRATLMSILVVFLFGTVLFSVFAPNTDAEARDIIKLNFVYSADGGKVLVYDDRAKLVRCYVVPGAAISCVKVP